MRFPDFFIVGAPKSGTTALACYLMEHPAIFMPKGEIHFLSRDFPLEREIRSWDDYIRVFAKAPRDVVVGEKSVSYLYSDAAAQEIRRHNPRAKIIIMLRNPISMMHSLYLHLLRDGTEIAESFEQALSLENERRRGRCIPKGAPGIGFLSYKHLATYHKHVERYAQLFPRENIMIVFFEEFFRNPQVGYNEVLEFLEVSPHVLPNFQPVNVGKSVRNPKLYRALSFTLIRAPIALLGDTRKAIPSSIRRFARRVRTSVLLRFQDNAKDVRGIPENLRVHLEEQFIKEAEILSNITGKDILSLWFPKKA